TRGVPATIRHRGAEDSAPATQKTGCHGRTSRPWHPGDNPGRLLRLPGARGVPPMKRPVKLAVGGLVLVAAGVGVAFAVPSCRSGVVGRIRGEPVAEGRTVGSWVETLRTGRDDERAHAAHVLGE